MVASITRIPKIIMIPALASEQLLSDILIKAFGTQGASRHWCSVFGHSVIEGPEHGPATGFEKLDVWYKVQISEDSNQEARKSWHWKEYIHEVDHSTLVNGINKMLIAVDPQYAAELVRQLGLGRATSGRRVSLKLADQIVQFGLFEKVRYQ